MGAYLPGDIERAFERFACDRVKLFGGKRKRCVLFVDTFDGRYAARSSSQRAGGPAFTPYGRKVNIDKPARL